MTARRQPRRPRSVRARLAAICLAALMLGAPLLDGTGAPERGPGTTPAGATALEATWTDANWTAAKGAEGTFTGLQLGNVQNLVCESALWSAAQLRWQRPSNAPSGPLTYRLTLVRGEETLTQDVTEPRYEYRRPAGEYDDVTITIEPRIEQWRGPSRSITLDAAFAYGLRCP